MSPADNRPLVSVIVPAYDVERWIVECLESLAAQTYPEWEAIVVIDGSLDRSEELARQFAERDERVSVVVTPNNGLGAARNAGLGLVQGTYVFFLDADDTLTPDALEILVAAAVAGDNEVVAAAGEDHWPDGTVDRYWSQQGELFDVGTTSTNVHKSPAILDDHVVWNKLYRTDVLKALDLRFPVSTHCEDIVFSARLALGVTRFGIVPHTVYRHRRHPEAISADYLRVRTLRDWLDQSFVLFDVIAAEEEQTLVDRFAGVFLQAQWWTRAKGFDRIEDPADVQGLERLAARILGLAQAETPDLVGARLAGVVEFFADGGPSRSWVGDSALASPFAEPGELDLSTIGDRVEALVKRLDPHLAADRAMSHALVTWFLLHGIRHTTDFDDPEESRAIGIARRTFERFGLPDRWHTNPPPQVVLALGRASHPLRVRQTGDVIVFPAWFGSNPYLNITYLATRAGGNTIVETRKFEELLAELEQHGEGSVLHLHWTQLICQREETEQSARERLGMFKIALSEYKGRGGRMVWTVHNALPHELTYRELELELLQHVADEADVVHVMDPSTPALVAEHYVLPPESLLHIPHPSYHGLYESQATRRDEIRQRFGIKPHQRTVLLFGQLRPYKGVDVLLAALRKIHERGGELPVLMLAGSTPPGGEEAITEALPPGLTAVRAHRFVPDEELADWFAAADLAIYPYTRILNSGSVHLAATMGVGAVLPGEDALREQFGTWDWVRFYDPSDPAGALADLLEADDSYLPAQSSAQEFSERLSPFRISRIFADLFDALLSAQT